MLSAVLVAVLVIVACPFSAWAADTTVTQNWWQVLLVEIIRVAVAVAVPALSVLIVKLVSLASRSKLNLELQQVQRIAQAAVAWAEEKAYKALKAGQVPTSSAEKMKTALTFAGELAERYKVPQKAQDQIQQLIESALGATRKTPPTA